MIEIHNKIVSAINSLGKGADMPMICAALLHTVGKIVMSDENPHNQNVGREDRKERFLETVNMVLETYGERVKFEMDGACLCT